MKLPKQHTNAGLGIMGVVKEVISKKDYWYKKGWENGYKAAKRVGYWHHHVLPVCEHIGCESPNIMGTCKKLNGEFYVVCDDHIMSESLIRKDETQ